MTLHSRHCSSRSYSRTAHWGLRRSIDQWKYEKAGWGYNLFPEWEWITECFDEESVVGDVIIEASQRLLAIFKSVDKEVHTAVFIDIEEGDVRCFNGVHILVVQVRRRHECSLWAYFQSRAFTLRAFLVHEDHNLTIVRVLRYTLTGYCDVRYAVPVDISNADLRRRYSFRVAEYF